MISLPYRGVLVIHILAITLFLSGFLLTSLSLPGLTRKTHPDAQALVEARRLVLINRFSTTPALLLVWLCGIDMAVRAGWFQATWLRLKLPLVATLTILYGVHALRLNRVAADATTPRSSFRPVAAICAVIVAVVALAVAKPL